MAKDIRFGIGVFLFAIGFAFIAFAGSQTKININQMTAADWQSYHINEIGTATEGKILSAIPITQISDLSTVDGIGTSKITVLQHHFTTYDTCRFEIFMAALIIGICFCIVGILLIAFVIIKQKLICDELKKTVSVIAGK
jgi:hypothetical protein